MKTLKEYTTRIGNLQLNTCDKSLGSSGELSTMEISQWADSGETRWVIAYWRISDEDMPNLHFVGDRPFDKKVNMETFLNLARIGQKELEVHYSQTDSYSPCPRCGGLGQIKDEEE